MIEQDTWLSDIVQTLNALGGEAHYSKIYAEAELIRKERGATWPDSAEAITRRVLEEQSSDTESFKGRDIFYSAQGLGKGIWGIRSEFKNKNTPTLNFNHNFEIGGLYNRKTDINGRYGGTYQGGMSSSAKAPYVFLFTGSIGEKYGYSDGWNEEGVFNYTGQGTIGDMSFTRNNKAVRDHVKEGKDLLLFQQREKGESYRFMGQFVCIGYTLEQIPDQNDNLREGIIFQLKNVDEEIDGSEIEDSNNTLSLQKRREKAYAAASPAKKTTSLDAKRTYYERNKSIKDYVLNRANGLCECCQKPAPFTRKDGSPYLEPHHIYKLSDKGMDHPRMVAAITPNCHREIHYGPNGADLDKLLEAIIAKKENELGVI